MIPARFGSTRLPGKPLRTIAGKPLIERVYSRAASNSCRGRVVVATDSDEIAKAVEAFGGECLLTRPDHPTGSDRIAEVAGKIPADVYVNIQGDEPLIDPLMIEEVLRPLQDDGEEKVVTLKSLFPAEEDIFNPNLVKVAVDLDDRALFFSRSPIPSSRQGNGVHFLHHGIYAFRREALLEFTASPPTPLEMAEGLEQLRFLELGYRIKAPTTRCRSIGVDTEGDLQKIEHILAEEQSP